MAQYSMQFNKLKYDRDPSGGKNQPRTQKAGSVFRDLHRLLLAGESESATSSFVYVTTQEMADYFGNPKNGCSDFFDLRQGSTLGLDRTYFSGRPSTFLSALGGEFVATVKSVISQSLAGSHQLRVYEVKSGRTD